MPNYGRSGGCRTCKRRRVKCDEGRPACSQCRRLRLECEGYNRTFSFRNQNHKFVQRSVKVVAVTSEPSRLLFSEAEVAVPFFLEHSARVGRSLVAARGFFETLIPVYNSQSPNSALSLAVSAVAARVFSVWCPDAKTAIESYAEAAAALRTAIGNPQERQKPATTLAILAMHLYENISAIYDLRPAMSVHHHGVLSLLPVLASDRLDGSASAYARSFVLHLEIASALRQKRSIHSNVLPYISDAGRSPVPLNISSALDLIGASVAELQAEYTRGLSSQQSLVASESRYRYWTSEVDRISELLRAWADSIPDYLQPMRLTGGCNFDYSIPAYHSTCDIYPSCQLATIWNLWRIQRIILLKITLGSAQAITVLSRNEFGGARVPRLVVAETTECVKSVQELVDGICYSVPFYLGNRTEPSSLADFNDRNVLFPSYHSLAIGDTLVAARRKDGDSIFMDKDEHFRHMIANGAWHAMSPLSSLLTLFSDDFGGRAMSGCLELGQQDWIREQFMRVATVLRLPAALPAVAAEPLRRADRSSPSASPIAETRKFAADYLAERVRQGAMFMSGS